MQITHPSGRFDNSARDYEHIDAVPLAAAMGAEIRGLDIAAMRTTMPPVEAGRAFAEVKDALFRHKMVFFRDQQLDFADQEAFSERFGPFAEDAYTKGTPEHPNVQPVIKEADTAVPMIFGSGWHTDSPFLATPPAISLLYGVELPPYGGDTIWANAALAFATLSPTMQTMIEPLRVRMSMANVLASAQNTVTPDDTPLGRMAGTKGDKLPPEMAKKVEGTAHPLVRAHPETGELSLYVDRTYASGIEGLSPAEAEPLLRFLSEHVTQPAFTCRLRWSAGTLAIWDNRLCVHQAFNDYDGFRREMYRTTIAGEVPRAR